MSQSRQLYLMRHAKSSWKYPLADLDRPLSERGLGDAPRMGQRLAQRQVCLDLIITSHALRALRTALPVARVLGYSVHQVQIQPLLYTDRAEDIITLIHTLDDRYERVMLIGHNPALTALANHYAHTPIVNVPTAGVVHLEAAIGQWREFQAERVELVDLDYPKRLDD